MIRLSEQQRAAVNHQDGGLLVVAGPGSGKTRVLTERIARLLRGSDENFRVLALTFTNKAANEMKQRLEHVPRAAERAFIGTLHSFCTEVLASRGKHVGITTLPFIFQLYQDRREILIQAIRREPELENELTMSGDQKEQNRLLDRWMQKIVWIKSHPISCAEVEDPLQQTIIDAYDATLRSNGGVDFEDLLALTYRLFVERPKIADFYRRLYRYVCIDEAQDLNEAQYAVIKALCSDGFRNIMMVGDPQQSVYGFNTADPRYMSDFEADFRATRIELTDNFRCSKAIVDTAQSLDPKYKVRGQLPIEGAVQLDEREDEKDEAKGVISILGKLIKQGHPDIEGAVTLDRCAVLSRTRYSLLKVEEELRRKGWAYYKQISSNYESESELVKEFELSLRIVANPSDSLHLGLLAKRWSVAPVERGSLKSGIAILRGLSRGSGPQRAAVVVQAVESIETERGKLRFMQALDVLQNAADDMDEIQKRSVLEDVRVWRGEWDRYIRSEIGDRHSLPAFLSNVSLGTTQQPKQEGIGLITVQSAKGLEFDVVFVVGMADGNFPDYRSKNDHKALAEERRIVFVAVTRSRRLLYLSYAKTKEMPWGDVWLQTPSPYLQSMGLTGA
ncbi:MAG TPA: ATP-dependent helicase [Candidatus Polarisedimenticolia bacterium]|nr:ATP-dependent helicase [Candidatus Polarisedimenticolia bacterium]